MKNYHDIVTHGLLPQIGDTIKVAYNWAYSFNENNDYEDQDEDGLYTKARDVLFFSEYPMLGYSTKFGSEGTFDINTALVCIVRKNPTIFHKISSRPVVTDYRGDNVESIERGLHVDNLPVYIETGDWFSFQPQTPVKILQGKYITEFMKLNFPEELKRYVK